MGPHPSPWHDPLSPVPFLFHTAATRPTKTAVVYGQERRTYAEFLDRASRLAAVLRALGIEKGDRVAALLWNTPEMLEAHFAVPMLEAILVAINTRLLPEEILYILEHSGCKALIVDTELAEPLARIEDRLPKDLKTITVTDRTLSPVHPVPLKKSEGDYEAALACSDGGGIGFSLEDENHTLAINYTSGTTGRPKGVMYTHRGAALNAFGTPIYSGINRDSVYLWTVPMFHCNGWVFPYSVTLVGGTHVCLRKFRPELVFDLVEKEGVTDLCGAPTVMLGICQYAAESGRRFPHCVRANTAGAPPSPTLLENCRKVGIEVKHLYGLTETYGPHTTCRMEPEWETLPLHEQALLLARQGVANANALHLRVVDSDMNDVPRDGETLGDVCMRGNNVMKGYFNNPEATEEAFRGGWFHSGDLGVMHPDGYIELRDRKKDIIISGGENISTIEVEKTVVRHPAVLECAVIAIPDDKWGEVPKAFVTLKPGATATVEEIVTHCRSHIAHFKCPKQVEFGELPKTATGKVQKFVLREREWAGREKRVN
ncbi:MAG: Long-chain-fatty-acid--CoA ligase [bacterium]|nr:Long-chain-fatty-acid--CoA ligase [bacterium]